MTTIVEKRGSIITAPNKDRMTLVLLTDSTLTSSSSNYRDYISRYPFTEEELSIIKNTGSNDAILLNPEIAPYKRVALLKVDKKSGEPGCQRAINRLYNILAFNNLFKLMMPRIGTECDLSWAFIKDALMRDKIQFYYNFDIMVYYPR